MDIQSGEAITSLTCGGPVNTLAWHPAAYILAYVGERDTGRIHFIRVPYSST